ALAVCRGVIDDGDDLRLLHACQVAGDRRPLLVVAPHHAELVLEALLGELGVGRRAGDHRDASLVVDRRGRNRGARVQVPDNAGDLRIDQLLRDRRTDLWTVLLIFRDEGELYRLAADPDASRLHSLERDARAILVYLAHMAT